MTREGQMQLHNHQFLMPTATSREAFTGGTDPQPNCRLAQSLHYMQCPP